MKEADCAQGEALYRSGAEYESMKFLTYVLIGKLQFWALNHSLYLCERHAWHKRVPVQRAGTTAAAWGLAETAISFLGSKRSRSLGPRVVEEDEDGNAHLAKQLSNLQPRPTQT